MEDDSFNVSFPFLPEKGMQSVVLRFHLTDEPGRTLEMTFSSIENRQQPDSTNALSLHVEGLTDLDGGVALYDMVKHLMESVQKNDGTLVAKLPVNLQFFNFLHQKLATLGINHRLLFTETYLYRLRQRELLGTRDVTEFKETFDLIKKFFLIERRYLISIKEFPTKKILFLPPAPNTFNWQGKPEQLNTLKSSLQSYSFIDCSDNVFKGAFGIGSFIEAVKWLKPFEQIHLLWLLQLLENRSLISKPSPYYKAVFYSFAPSQGVFTEAGLKDSNKRLNNQTDTDKEPYATLSSIVNSLTIP